MDITQLSNKQRIGIIQQVNGLPVTGYLDTSTRYAIKNIMYRLSPNTMVGFGITNIISGDILPLNLFEAIVRHLGLDVAKELNSITFESENLIDPSDDVNVTSDLMESNFHLDVNEHMLSSHEYVSDRGEFANKEYIFLHHTAGWEDPFKTVDMWENDTRGRIGTHYVLGGINIKTHDPTQDGVLVKCIPDKYFAWHLGGYTSHGIDPYMHKHSIGIEICNFGQLTKEGDEFCTYTGRAIDERYVEDLGFEFRGHRYWHKYTDAQIEKLRLLLIALSNQFDIDLSIGLCEKLDPIERAYKGFGFDRDARDGKIKGLLSHTNVRRDKMDVSPQRNLIKMLKSL